jgi:hypothetical protein
VPFDFLKHAAQLPVDHPLLRLPTEDLDLITELVLQSGSLKDLAAAYGVSYPTIRARLDRVIERLQFAIKGDRPDALTDLLARLIERGEISPGNAWAVRETARRAAQGPG